MSALTIRGILLLGTITLLLSTVIEASPPARVARLSYIKGAVSFLPAGVDEWVNAVLNRPLTTWDRLWVDKNAQAKLELDASTVCIGDNTNLSILNLDDKIAQFQLTEGRLNVSVKSIAPNQDYEIDTPNFAFLIHKEGDYKIDVDSEGNTNLTVFSGEGEVFGEQVSYNVVAGQTYHFIGTILSNNEKVDPKTTDLLDTSCFNESPKHSHYISNRVIGYEDLENHGEWVDNESYGPIWMPTAVAVDWAPYRYGIWAWIEPWGWTWIDDQSWGFAPFHYGRWTLIEDHWYWIPGPPAAEPVYAPALVEFINLDNEIAWFPLGYNEIYVPPYHVTRNYFININNNNTTIGSERIARSYNDRSTQRAFMNARFTRAVSAVSTKTFTSGQPIIKPTTLSSEVIAQGRLSTIPLVAPVLKSITASGKAKSQPKASVVSRATVAKSAPAAMPISFSKKEMLLNENKGKPLGIDEVKTLETPAPSKNIKLLAPSASREERTKIPEQGRIPEQRQVPEHQRQVPEKRQVPIQPEVKQSTPSTIPKVNAIPDNKVEQERQNKAIEEAARRAAEQSKAAAEAARRAAEEVQGRAAAEAAKRAAEEVQGRAAAEAARRAAEEVQGRAAAEAARRAAEEVQGRAAAEAARRAAEEVQGRAAAEAAKRAAEEIQGRAAAEAARRAAEEIQGRAAAEAARRAAGEVQGRSAAEAAKKAAQEAARRAAAQESESSRREARDAQFRKGGSYLKENSAEGK